LGVLIVIAALLGGVVTFAIMRRGLSTRTEPTAVEKVVARAVRRLATPQAARTRQNPVEPTEVLLADAMAHFADHCAVCHANDGSGDTAVGRALYPRAPDMRAPATQSLSDGELFSIIENGVRLTGMPAWGTGTPEGERESWGLVHLVRRLPRLTSEEIERMESLTPKTPAQLQEEEETRRFLEGDDTKPSPGSPPNREHRHP
jgi:mono/diheme cytochrome c family protein